MSAEENLAKATAQLEAIGVTINAPLLEKIQKSLGIANLGKDSSLVATSDPEELARVQKSCLEKKLGLIHDDAANQAAIAEVGAQLKEFRQKQRSAFYYLLTVKFGKEDKYLG